MRQTSISAEDAAIATGFERFYEVLRRLTPRAELSLTAASTLRPVRKPDCAGGCTITCEAGEALVTAHCLKAGTPVYDGEGARCPAEASGIVGFCTRP